MSAASYSWPGEKLAGASWQPNWKHEVWGHWLSKKQFWHKSSDKNKTELDLFEWTAISFSKEKTDSFIFFFLDKQEGEI